MPRKKSELDKLESYLKKKKINYERLDQNEKWDNVHGVEIPVSIDRHQITVFDKCGKYAFDVICQKYSFGYPTKLEAMGCIVKKKLDVEGYMTAEDVIARIEKLKAPIL